MGTRRALLARDELERTLLQEAAAAPDGRLRAALQALHLPRRDRIDDMWAGSPMRVSEARAIAKWLGYEIRLKRVVPRDRAAAYRDEDPNGNQPALPKRRAG